MRNFMLLFAAGLVTATPASAQEASALFGNTLTISVSFDDTRYFLDEDGRFTSRTVDGLT